MKKIRENKKILIFAGVILAVVVVLLLATQCNKKELDNSNDSNGSKDSESSIGLEVGDPEEADKADIENQVDFVGPDGTANNDIDNNSTGSNSTGNGESVNNNNNSTGNGSGEEDSDNTDISDNTNDSEDNGNNEDTGNLDEELDNNGKYGGFF